MTRRDQRYVTSTCPHVRLVLTAMFAAIIIPPVSAQKVTVGYDKTVDFTAYKTFSLQPPANPPSRPLVYASVIGTITDELQAKGLRNANKDSNLILIASGDIGYGLSPNPNLLSDSCSNCQTPLRDPRPWAGSPPPVFGTSGKPAPKGTLQLTFIERTSNKLVWSGTVVQKLNEDKKEESLQRIAAAIKKLLAEFPPGGGEQR